MLCIYCAADASGSKKQYHVAPHAAGNTVEHRHLLGEIVLPKGLACDECNEYFGLKVEPGVANHPYVQQYRAVYSIRSRKGYPLYKDSQIEIVSRQSGLVVLSGSIELTSSGSFRVPPPSLQVVNHLQTSRALHKIALEYELLEIARSQDWKTALGAIKQPPLSTVARYVRYGHYSSYRPYGVELKGATRVSIVPRRFEADPKGILISPPNFTGYIIGLPGARFSCTLAEDASLLGYMLNRIERTEARNYLITRNVYWSH
jgi:hypothetical protein